MQMLDEYLTYIQDDNVTEAVPLLTVGKKIAKGATKAGETGAAKTVMGMTPLGAAAIAVSLFFTLLGGYRNYLSKAARACDGIVDIKLKNKCMVDYKLRGAKDFKSKLNSAKNKCKGSEGCLNKFDRKMGAMDTKIEKYTNQLRTINL